MRLRLLVLYPERLNLHADQGNLLVLRRRAEWRGIRFEMSEAGVGDTIRPDGFDLAYIGGGPDPQQRLVAPDLVETKREGLAKAHRDGRPILAVCGGLQLLGHSFELDGERIPGAGLANIETVRPGGDRLVGPIVVETDLDGIPRTVSGFENHAGRVELGTGATAFGRVLHGHGNNGRDRLEGVRDGSLLGTSLHGPLLPRNAWLADYLIRSALTGAGTDPVTLEPLDDTLEVAAHRAAVNAAEAG